MVISEVDEAEFKRMSAASDELSKLMEPYEEYDIDKIKTMAEAGDVNAQYKLAARYHHGSGGVEKDGAKWIKWVKLSAAQNHAWAQYSLGLSYDLGKEVPEDKELAVKYYRMSAEQGDSDSAYYLGLFYNNGKDVKQDDIEALRWHTYAARRGKSNAQYMVGLAHDAGMGVLVNKKLAAKWYRLATMAGNDLRAQNNLGMLYMNGEGVSKNRVLAYVWFDLARENDGDNEKAINNFVENATNMSESEFAEAVKLKAQCVASDYEDCGDDLLDAEFMHKISSK